jgi:hypothetical protein
MEKKIAIRGHKTRGKEVIRALEEMGGTNEIGFDGSNSNYAYYIRHDFMISIEKLDKPPLGEPYSLYTIEEYKEYMKNKKEAEHSGAKKLVEEEALKQYVVPTGSIKIWNLPEGCQFTDENDNVINATKIILEKKKKEYPKTYGECCELLGKTKAYQSVSGYKTELLEDFQKLLICRDAYWKIAGEEMGLDEPWEPDWKDAAIKYVLTFSAGNIIRTTTRHYNYILAFPTEEMRDAFYENFKELINRCKELL